MSLSLLAAASTPCSGTISGGRLFGSQICSLRLGIDCKTGHGEDMLLLHRDHGTVVVGEPGKRSMIGNRASCRKSAAIFSGLAQAVRATVDASAIWAAIPKKATWADYCPNAPTLQELQIMKVAAG